MFNLNGLIEDISNEFLKNNVDLNDIIADRAAKNDLLPEQIKRVIEGVNVVIFNVLLSTLENKDFEFPVADYKIVSRKLNENQLDDSQPLSDKLRLNKHELIDSTPFDVFSDKIHDIIENAVHRDEEPDENAVFNPDFYRDKKQQLRDIQIKLNNIEDEIDILKNQLSDHMKEAVASEGFESLVKFASAAVPEMYYDILVPALDKVAGEMADKVEDTALADYLNNNKIRTDSIPNQDIRVVNTNHPIILDIKQIKNKNKERSMAIADRDRIQDEIKIHVTKSQQNKILDNANRTLLDEKK